MILNGILHLITRFHKCLSTHEMQDFLSFNKAEQLKAIKISQNKLCNIDLGEFTNTNKNNLNSIGVYPHMKRKTYSALIMLFV